MKLKVFQLNTGGTAAGIAERVEAEGNKLIQDHPYLNPSDIQVTSIDSGSGLKLILVFYKENKEAKAEVI